MVVSRSSFHSIPHVHSLTLTMFLLHTPTPHVRFDQFIVHLFLCFFAAATAAAVMLASLVVSLTSIKPKKNYAKSSSSKATAAEEKTASYIDLNMPRKKNNAKYRFLFSCGVRQNDEIHLKKKKNYTDCDGSGETSKKKCIV